MPKTAVSELITFLQSQLVAVVSSVSAKGQPQAATVFFWLDERQGDKFSLFFITRRDSRKFDNLMRDPRVAMVIGTAMRPTTVQVDGRATLMDMCQGLKDLRGFSRMMETHGLQKKVYAGEFYPSNPFQDTESETYALFRVRPTSITMMSYDAKNKKLATRKML